MCKVEIEILDELPTQVGTKFLLVVEDGRGIHTIEFIVTADGEYTSIEDKQYSEPELQEYSYKIIALPHAELRALYEQTGSDTTKWEFFFTDNDVWVQLVTTPSWLADIEYRYTGYTIQINGVRVPRPICEAPTVGTTYYAVDLLDVNPNRSVWHGTTADYTWLRCGLLHLHEQDALAHAGAIIAANTKER